MMSLKTFIANYIYLYFRRQKLEQYEASCKRSNQDYIFFISTLWSHENCVASTNVFRSEYMLYCHNHPKILFEGGFPVSYTHLDVYKRQAIGRAKYKRTYEQLFNRENTVSYTHLATKSPINIDNLAEKA